MLPGSIYESDDEEMDLGDFDLDPYGNTMNQRTPLGGNLSRFFDKV